MERDRSTREQDIIAALERLLRKDGFRSLGINAIAKEAGCNKVLIYRYFGGLEGLFHTFAQKMSLLSPPTEIKPTESSLSQNTLSIFTNQIESLKNNTLLKEIMKWELIEQNELTNALANEREEKSNEIMKKALPLFSSEEHEIDLEAITAILSAGLSYLMLRADTARYFNGVDLQSDAGWNRIENGLEQLIAQILKQ